RLWKQRVELPPGRGVPAGRLLQVDLASDGLAGRGAVGMEVGGPVVPFDDRDRAARPDELTQGDERVDGAREMLQHEAHEEVVERRRAEGQREEVRLQELYVPHAGRSRLRLGGPDGFQGKVDRDDARPRAPTRERDGLGAHATPGL